MKNNAHIWLSILVALVLSITFGLVLTMYVPPMDDVSLDLSLSIEDSLEDPIDFDSKGWTVFIQEGDIRTELQNNGFGGYNRAPMPPAQPMQPATPRYAQPVSPFEPDDPIPEAEPDRKHRPRFVDFFMRKNNEDNE